MGSNQQRSVAAESAAAEPLAFLKRVRARLRRDGAAAAYTAVPASEAAPESATALSPESVPDDEDSYEGTCNVCGEAQTFVRNNPSLREGYRCASCKASLRYRGQADAMLRHYATHGSTSVAELVTEPEFAGLSFWEPGTLGPFRDYIGQMPKCVTTNYWPDVPPGEHREGVRCENLMALTFPAESFDLIVTSDILEHVRKPYVAFAEMHRVLRPGGRHIFSIPVQDPMRAVTVERVDTSGDDDVHVLEPRYHVGHQDNHYLVYNDFGADIVDRLTEVGFDTEAIRFEAPNEEASRLVTFCSVKR